MHYSYTKIDTPFSRDMEGSKKPIYGRFRNDVVEYLANDKWYGTEKIDGTNIGIHWDGHHVSFQGRSAAAQIPAHLINKLNELFGGNANEEIFEELFGSSEVILYGEGYGAKIQKGGNYIPDGVDFILFDIYFPASQMWLRRKDMEDIAKAFNINVVPIVFEGDLWQAIDYVKLEPDSTIGQAKMEGIVIQPLVQLFDRMGNRVMVKVKVNDCREMIFENGESIKG